MTHDPEKLGRNTFECKMLISRLHDLLTLDHETGDLYFKERTVEMFKASSANANRACASWNGKWAGKSALRHINSRGYKVGKIDNMTFSAHRVVYAMTRGHWPTHSVDHINGVSTDNRPSNLRDVPQSVNAKNKTNLKPGESGYLGVSFFKRTKRWQARIGINGVSKSIGYFSTKEEAISARRKAEKEFGYTQRHGGKENG